MTITCRELFEIEHPDRDIDEWCPHHFNYLETDCIFVSDDCDACWDREATNAEKCIAVLAKNAVSTNEVQNEEQKEPKSWAERIDENLAKANGTTIVNLPYIKDSGERREFKTGAVRDIQEGKGRCDLMPLDVVADWFKHSFTYDERVQKVFSNIERFKETGSVDYLYEVLSYGNTMFVNSETMFLETAKHFEAGAVKYGENNWQKGIPVHCYIDSAVRHYLKFLRGDDDEPHDRAFVWNIMCCIWTCVHKPELNDFCEVKEETESKGYNPVEKAYGLLTSILDADLPEIEEAIGYLGEALNE